MKFKHRELLLLIAYMAMLVPFFTGQVLCINRCGSDYETGSVQDCCCHAPQVPAALSCCPQSSSESAPIHAGACIDNQCLCVDVPLDAREPHYTVRNTSQAPLLFETPAMLTTVVLTEDSGISSKSISPLPGDINNLNTIILLI